MNRNTSQHSQQKFIDSRTASTGRKRNQSKYYPGSVFVHDGQPERTFVIEYATPKSSEVKIYGAKDFGSKNMIGLNGARHVKKQKDIDELRNTLRELYIVISGMDKARGF